MKRILFSLLCSSTLLVLWLFISLVLEFSKLFNHDTIEKLAIPFRLPKYIYIDILQLQSPEDTLQSVILVSSAILFNILLYSFIFYGGIMLFSKIRKKPQIEKIETPPEPPVFK